MLLFKKKFLPDIRSGKKTQTIRLWRCFIPGAGYIRIDQVKQIELEDLTDADAIPDGFATADALRKEINDIYADKLDAGHKAFRVEFHLLEEAVRR